MSCCTYDPNLGTPLDFVRFLLGDTGAPDDCFFADAEILAILAEVGGSAVSAKYCAAALLWDNFLARLGSDSGGTGTFGPIVEKMVGRLRIRYSDQDTLQEGLQGYGNYLKSRCAQLASARPVWFQSLGKNCCPRRRVVKSSGEGGT